MLNRKHTSLSSNLVKLSSFVPGRIATGLSTSFSDKFILPLSDTSPFIFRIPK